MTDAVLSRLACALLLALPVAPGCSPDGDAPVGEVGSPVGNAPVGEVGVA
ncbi:MAG: hypothetical protein FWF71_06985 [Actinomycetia bacterium]|nr:hypothetical protein [Actinomycetes bacterium]